MRMQGFTLIEVIIAMTLMAIIVVLLTVALQQPLRNFTEQNARTQLVNSADVSLTRIAQDLRRAIPNSVRVSPDGRVIEMLLIHAGIYYRDGIVGQTEALAVGVLDSEFHGLGDLTTLSGSYRLIVNSTATQNLYNAAVGVGSGVMTPVATTVTLTTCAARANCLAGEGPVTAFVLSQPFQFDPIGQGSPRNRMYLTETAVTYHCDPSNNENILRYAFYTLAANQPINRSANPLAAATQNNVLVNNVVGCQFRYAQGSAQRRGVVTLSIQLLNGSDQVQLLHQVQVNNAP